VIARDRRDRKSKPATGKHRSNGPERNARKGENPLPESGGRRDRKLKNLLPANTDQTDRKEMLKKSDMYNPG
jgi:hypothetical protein